jgi:site-specific recombinase XerD
MDVAFADFLRIDVANGDASPNTIRNYRNEVALWVAWCVEQNFDAATVTPVHIKRYRQALIERNYNRVTIRWKLSILRRFYEAARNAGLRNDNPAAGVKSPRVRQATEDFKYLCDEELAKFLAVIPDPEQAKGPEKVRRLRNLLMVSMMSLQALRTIEVHRANIEDLLEKGAHLTLLVRGKTRDRIIYLRPDTAERMKHYVALRGIRVQTDKCLEAAGLKHPGISNHALRHTAATLGYLHTGDLRAVQEFLGHSDPRMTSRYERR